MLVAKVSILERGDFIVLFWVNLWLTTSVFYFKVWAASLILSHLVSHAWSLHHGGNADSHAADSVESFSDDARLSVMSVWLAAQSIQWFERRLVVLVIYEAWSSVMIKTHDYWLGQVYIVHSESAFPREDKILAWIRVVFSSYNDSTRSNRIKAR